MAEHIKKSALSANYPGIAFQPRDLAFLGDLFECRAMTAAHAAALHFGGSKEAAKKRLQKLKAAGLISERPRSSTEPAIHLFSPKAFPLLRNHGFLHEYPVMSTVALNRRSRVSDLTLKHELEVMDVKAAFHSSIQEAAHLSTAEFCTWPRLHQFEVEINGRGVLVKPDGFIRIHEKESDGGLSEHNFFLELDRSSESQETLVSRTLAYRSYYSSGGFAAKNGAPITAFREYPFIVLIVLKSKERRNNTALRLLQSTPPVLTQAFLTTKAEVSDNPLGPIWVTPRVYRDAVSETPFDVQHPSLFRSYRTDGARESFVETRLRKISLFDVQLSAK
jgi:hypothetical protein